MSVIEARDLKKSFRIPSIRRDTLRDYFLDLGSRRTFEELKVLDGVSFAVEPGETLGIMGRNGSGKSTLLKILCGIYSPDAGTVVARRPLTPILELGVGWDPELDAVDNILLIGTVLGLSLRDAKASMDEILEFADLTRFARLELKHYSSGMALRLAYSVAFRAVRDVLVLDEVFAVGDAGFRARCEARYRELHGAGHTIVLVSHDPRVIGEFCERALLIDAGRIVCEGGARSVGDAYLELLARAPRRSEAAP